MSNQKLTEIQDAYAAFSRGGIPVVLGTLDADVEWTEDAISWCHDTPDSYPPEGKSNKI